MVHVHRMLHASIVQCESLWHMHGACMVRAWCARKAIHGAHMLRGACMLHVCCPTWRGYSGCHNSCAVTHVAWTVPARHPSVVQARLTTHVLTHARARLARTHARTNQLTNPSTHMAARPCLLLHIRWNIRWNICTRQPRHPGAVPTPRPRRRRRDRG